MCSFTIVAKPHPSQDIERTCKDAGQLANKLDARIEFTVNKLCLYIDPGMQAEDVIDFYYREMTRRSKKKNRKN